jgi:membrane associated rhomboid family serine protease
MNENPQQAINDSETLAKQDRRRLKDAVSITLALVVAIWAIKLLEMGFDLGLHRVGLYPMRPSGLVGILTAPLIHGSIEHTVSNTLPLLLLGVALHYAYPKSRWWVIAIIWIGSGIGTWLWGRPSYHFGASGLTHGLMFFIFLAGIIRRDSRSVVMAMLAFYMYGSMVWGIFPREPGISFELHLFGAIAGVLCARRFTTGNWKRNWKRKARPLSPRKKKLPSGPSTPIEWRHVGTHCRVITDEDCFR